MDAAFDCLPTAMEAGGPRRVAEAPVRAAVPKLTATHVKELIGEVREKSEDAIAPMTGLLAEAA